jgi:hypothetical protein
VLLIDGIIQVHQAVAKMRHPKLLSGHSQMGTAANFRPRDMFITHRSRFNCICVGPRILNRRLQRLRKLVWEEREDCLPKNSINPRINPAIGLRHRGFVGDPHGVLAVLLRAQSELVALDLL